MSTNAVKAAWLDVGDELDAVGNAAVDEAVRDDLRETGRRLVDAMGTTFREATRAVRGITNS